MAQVTVTEALAELKTIDKRLEKKRDFVAQHLYRQDRFKDPLEKAGGSVSAIQAERQAIADLEQRKVLIRRRINEINLTTTIGINGVTRTLADWLIWKRDVAPGYQAFLLKVAGQIATIRQQAMQKGLALTQGQAANPDDIVVNIDERALAKEREDLEGLLGQLDGQLSLKNAITTIEV